MDCIGERCKMPTQLLPAASLRSIPRLPAARALVWASNYLILMVLWSIGRAIFRVESNFLPALREGRAAIVAIQAKCRPLPSTSGARCRRVRRHAVLDRGSSRASVLPPRSSRAEATAAGLRAATRFTKTVPAASVPRTERRQHPNSARAVVRERRGAIAATTRPRAAARPPPRRSRHHPPRHVRSPRR